MPPQFVRTLTHKVRSKKADRQLGITLAFLAGAVNAGGFLAVGYYTSHMTGIVSRIADTLALYQWHMALMAALFLLAFICGAITSCLIINVARARNSSSEFAFALMLEAVLLLIFGFSASQTNTYATLSTSVTIALLCFIMGLQNAVITKISHAEIRTTHVTGICTDIGIEIGRYLYAWIDKAPHVARHPDKLALHFALLVAFLGGGIVGAFSFKYVGFIMTAPFALLLFYLAAVPLLDDLEKRRQKNA